MSMFPARALRVRSSYTLRTAPRSLSTRFLLTAACLSERLQAAFSPPLVESLRRRGWAVVDEVLSPAESASLSAEICALEAQSHQNCTHLVGSSGTRLLPKPGIFESELSCSLAAAAAPQCALFQADDRCRALLRSALPGLALGSQALKAQTNRGAGACFPLHADSDASLDGRAVTAVWYLSPAWEPEQGGELEICPWPAPPVRVPPRAGRLALFSSRAVPHRVLPALAPRRCFSVWFSEDEGGAAQRRARLARARDLARQALSSPGELTPLQALRALSLPALRLLAAKLALAPRWRTSLRESHAGEPGLAALLDGHDREVRVLEEVLGGVMRRSEELWVEARRGAALDWEQESSSAEIARWDALLEQLPSVWEA